MQTSAATMENRTEVPQKIKSRLTYDPIITLLGIYPNNTKTLIQRDTCTPMLTATLFTIANNGSNPCIHQQMNDKEDVVYTHTHTHTHTHTQRERERERERERKHPSLN